MDGTNNTATGKRRSTEFKKLFRIGLTAFLVIVASVPVIFLFVNRESVHVSLDGFFSAFTPVILGLVFAYVMNPLLNFIEKYMRPFIYKHAKNKAKAKKTARGLSILSTVILILMIIGFLVYLLAPQLTETVTGLINEIPGQIASLRGWIAGYSDSNNEVGAYIAGVVDNALTSIQTSVGNSDLFDQIDTVVSGVKSIFGAIYNVLIGLVFAIYILSSKEIFAAQIKKLMNAFFKQEKMGRFFYILSEAHKKFTGAITGKIVDSCLVGLICFVGMLIFGFPYPTLISVIVGVTNVIPFFGPYIGAIPSALLVLFASPRMCIGFVIFIIVLQQIDCNILDPRIVGGSIGLSAFWVLFACVVFGGIFGIVGLLLGVPLTACLYTLFKSIIEARLEKRGMPTLTDDYLKKEFDK